MKKNILTVIVIIAAFAGLYLITSQKPTKVEDNSVDILNANTSPTVIPTIYPNPDLTLYWGQGCPHCEKVEEFIKTNNIDQKLKINRKEVFRDTTNASEFKDVVNQNCSDLVKSEGIGVPVVFDPISKKCYQGDTPIIDYLTEKTK